MVKWIDIISILQILKGVLQKNVIRRRSQRNRDGAKKTIHFPVMATFCLPCALPALFCHVQWSEGADAHTASRPVSGDTQSARGKEQRLHTAFTFVFWKD